MFGGTLRIWNFRDTQKDWCFCQYVTNDRLYSLASQGQAATLTFCEEARAVKYAHVCVSDSLSTDWLGGRGISVRVRQIEVTAKQDFSDNTSDP